jgi:hypothetical protein
MKKAILLIAALFGVLNLFAQKEKNLAGPSTYSKCTKFSITPALRDMPIMTRRGTHEEAHDRVRRVLAAAQRAKFTPGPVVTDPVIQSANGDRTMNGPIENFDGMQCGDDPPDPDGAVGPNNFVEAMNTAYQVFDKAGNSIAGPIDDSVLFAPDDYDDGDPIVLYDKFADRWFISQFQVTATPYQLLVAISTTNDPAGSYYIYRFNMGSTNADFPDYPKYSIWPDGYYCTAQFGSPQRIIVLERNRMLAGSPSAGMILANLPSSPPFCDDNSLTSAPKTLDCDGALPPYGTPNYLVFYNNTNSGGYSNSIYLEKLVTDTTLHTITATIDDSLAVQPFNGYFTGGSLNDISQPGQPFSLDALDGTFNFRVPYMRFTGYNSVVLSNTVNIGNHVAGIRWYELRQNDTTLHWSIYQQGTYAPADRVSRWNGSICMNNNGDISLAYCVSDSNTTYPGIRYTGRLASDPLGQMTFAEQTAVAGQASYLGVGGRVGDYSQSTLDPSDGITFWHVNEYGGTGGNENTRIFSFQLNGPTSLASLQENNAVLKAYQAAEMLNVKATSLPTNDKVFIDLFDVNGKQLSSQSVTPGDNMVTTQINVSNLAEGVYFVRLGNVNYQRVEKVILN